MSTFNSRAVVDEIISKDGYCEDDPRVHMIVEYDNAYGGVAYGVTWVNESREMRTRYLEETHWVRNPRVLWVAE